MTLAGQHGGERSPGRLEQGPHLGHGDGIGHLSVIPTRHDEQGAAQDGQLLGQVARLDVDLREQLVDGMLALAEQLEDPDPGRVSEGSEKFGLRLIERYAQHSYSFTYEEVFTQMRM